MTRVPEIRYLPLERLTIKRPVDRIAYIRAKCRGRKVLDLGAWDETEIARTQHATWKWLHREIAGSAREVLGVDASETVRQKGPLRTSFGTTIQYGRVEDLEGLVAAFGPDLIVAGELIEHTPDPGGWLTALGRSQPGVEILVTTPNATSVANIGLALVNREMMHRDHVCVYSYKTLMTLGARLRLKNMAITPYYYRTSLLRGRAPGFLGPAILLADYLIGMPIQFLFPLTAGGLILEGRFPEDAPGGSLGPP